MTWQLAGGLIVVSSQFFRFTFGGCNPRWL